MRSHTLPSQITIQHWPNIGKDRQDRGRHAKVGPTLVKFWQANGWKANVGPMSTMIGKVLQKHHGLYKQKTYVVLKID